MKTFGERLKFVFDTKNIRQNQIAMKLGVTPGAINSYVKNRSFPVSAFFEELKREVPNLNLNWLIVNIGDPFEGEEKQPMVLKQEMEAIKRERDELALYYFRTHTTAARQVAEPLGKSKGVYLATVSIRRNNSKNSFRFAENIRITPTRNGVHTH